MDWQVIQDRQYPDHWRVEAINHDGDGEAYVATFSGPEAQRRAEEYAAWKAEVARAA